MKAVIMVGGQGTRLRPLTVDTPKPLLDVGGKPLLFSIIEHLKRHGVDQIFLCTNYKAEQFQKSLGDGKQLGVKISYSLEKEPLGTAGPLKLLEKQLQGEPFFVMNGDLLTTADLSAMAAFHKENKADFTLGTRNMVLPVAYGAVEVKGDAVVGMKEKPNVEMEINAGIYVLSPSVLSLLPAGKTLMTDFIRQLIGKKKKVLRHRLEGIWIDIGQIDDYKRANEVARNA